MPVHNVCIQQVRGQCQHATATSRLSVLSVARRMKSSTCTVPSTDVDQLDAAWNRARSLTRSDRTSSTTAVTPTCSVLLIGSAAVVTSVPSDYLIQTLSASLRATRSCESIWRSGTRVRKVRPCRTVAVRHLTRRPID